MSKFRTSFIVLAIAAAAAFSSSPAGATELDANNRAVSFADPSGFYVNGYFPCDSAHDWTFPTWPIRFMNDINCNRRVFLYDNIDKTGHVICVSPGNTRSIPEEYDKPAIVAVGKIAICP